MKRAWMASAVLSLVLPWAVDAQTPATLAMPAARTLSIATLAPAGSTWMTVLNAWNRELRRRTQARLALRFYPGGVQGDEAEVVRNPRRDGFRPAQPARRVDQHFRGRLITVFKVKLCYVPRRCGVAGTRTRHSADTNRCTSTRIRTRRSGTFLPA